MERGEIIARKQRVWFPGATYHLMERGIRRQAIYKEDGDYQVFISILQSGLEKYGCILSDDKPFPFVARNRRNRDFEIYETSGRLLCDLF